MDHLETVLLWLLLAFLAGFVGQFGKSLTLRLLAKGGRRRQGSEGARPAAGPRPAERAVPENKAAAKLEKKRLKAALKARKKGRELEPND